MQSTFDDSIKAITASLPSRSESAKFLCHNVLNTARRLGTVAQNSFLAYVFCHFLVENINSQAGKAMSTDIAGPTKPVDAANFWIVSITSLLVFFHGGFNFFYLLSEQAQKSIKILIQSCSTFGLAEFLRQENPEYAPYTNVIKLLSAPGFIQFLFFILGKEASASNIKSYLDSIRDFFSRRSQTLQNYGAFEFFRNGGAGAGGMAALVGTFIEYWYNSTHEKNLSSAPQALLISSIIGFLLNSGAANDAMNNGSKVAKAINENLGTLTGGVYMLYYYYQTWNIINNPALARPETTVQSFKAQQTQENVAFLMILLVNALRVVQNIYRPGLGKERLAYQSVPNMFSEPTSCITALIKNFIFLMLNMVGCNVSFESLKKIEDISNDQ